MSVAAPYEPRRIAPRSHDPGGILRDSRESANPVSAGSDAHGDVTVERVELSAELAGAEGQAATADVAEYALWLGDDALVLSQQLSAWIARAPELEEDVALANIALDLLGHARSLLRYAGTYDGRSEDDLAYWRDEPAFRCAWLFVQPNGDFAQTVARQLAASVYQFELYSALCESSDSTLAAIAAKAVKEVEYHREHATSWVLRLGDGTEESHRRMQDGLDRLWPLVGELFESDEVTGRLASGIGVDPAALRPEWDDHIDKVLAAATLSKPERGWLPGTGRRGRHSEHLGYLLAEMQYLHRLHPGATW